MYAEAPSRCPRPERHPGARDAGVHVVSDLVLVRRECLSTNEAIRRLAAPIQRGSPSLRPRPMPFWECFARGSTHHRPSADWIATGSRPNGPTRGPDSPRETVHARNPRPFRCSGLAQRLPQGANQSAADRTASNAVPVRARCDDENSGGLPHQAPALHGRTGPRRAHCSHATSPPG